MLVAAVFNIKGQNRNLNVSYIMTDGGHLRQILAAMFNFSSKMAYSSYYNLWSGI